MQRSPSPTLLSSPQTNVPAAAPGSGAAPAEPPAKKKRSLEDLMGEPMPRAHC